MTNELYYFIGENYEAPVMDALIEIIGFDAFIEKAKKDYKKSEDERIMKDNNDFFPAL